MFGRPSGQAFFRNFWRKLTCYIFNLLQFLKLQEADLGS